MEVENERLERTAKLSRLYERIGPNLMKLEYLILGTSTGRSEVMSSYYTFWEKKIFKSLVTLVYNFTPFIDPKNEWALEHKTEVKFL